MNRTARLAIASIMALAVFAGVPSIASAQQQQDNEFITFDVQQVDVREALRAIFKSTSLSYTVDPKVQGMVTASFHHVPLATVLENVVRQVKATYRIVGGVYEIVPHEDIQPDTKDVPAPAGQGRDNRVIRRIYVRSADPMLIAILASQKGQNFNLSPEMSTVLKNGQGFGNQGSGNQGFGNQGFGGSGNGFGMGSGFGGSNFGFGNSNGFGSGSNNSNRGGNGNRGGGNRG